MAGIDLDWLLAKMARGSVPGSRRGWRAGGWWLWWACVLGVVVTPALASGPAPDPIAVVPSDDEVEIEIADLLVPHDLTLADVESFEFTSPSYGTLSRDGDTLVYAPDFARLEDSSLWAHGTDSFTYTFSVISGIWGSTQYTTTTAMIVAHRFGTLRSGWDFEDGQTPWTAPGFEAMAMMSAALGGLWGLELGLPDDPPTSITSAMTTSFGDDGAPSDSGSGCARVDHDPFGGLTLGGPVDLLAAGPDLSKRPIRLVLRDNAGTYEVRGEAVDDDGVLQASQWHAITAGPHTYELDWWAQGDTVKEGGFQVIVDGTILGRRTGIALGGRYDVSTVMGVGDSYDAGGTLHLDDIQLTHGPERVGFPLVTPMRAEGFESGLVGWENQASTDALVLGSASLTGNLGLWVPAQSVEPYVLDTVPTSHNFGIRWRVGFDGLNLAEGERITLFTGSSAAPPAQDLHLWVKLIRKNGILALRAIQETVTGAFVKSPWVPLSYSGATVELGWQAPSHPSKADGRLRLWVDGALAAKIEGLDMGNRTIDGYRLGAINATGNNVGALWFDNVETWTTGPLLPLVTPP